MTATRKVPVGAIAVGERDREDLGDVAGLAESIRMVGLLHPVVVTEALALVAGGRRLAAVQHLGWTEVPVTVVDLSTVTDALRAEADENTERKPLTPYEASRARERRARVLAEDAAKRVGGRPRKEETSSKLDEVSRAADAPARATRKVAALGTGYSGSTLDKVDKIRDIAERGVVPVGTGQQRQEVPAPPEVREVAERELERVKKTGAAVDPAAKSVGEALKRYVEADPAVVAAAWRKNFMGAIARSGSITAFTPEQAAENADAELVAEVVRLAANLTDYAQRVEAAWRKANGGLRLVAGGAR